MFLPTAKAILALLIFTALGFQTSCVAKVFDMQGWDGEIFNLQCELPAYNEEVMSGAKCQWWRDNQPISETPDYVVLELAEGKQCRLTIRRDAAVIPLLTCLAPTEYKCSAGNKLADASEDYFRVWPIVLPDPPKIKVNGKIIIENLDLSTLLADEPATIECFVEESRPAVKLRLFLDDSLISTLPNEERNLSDKCVATAIRWRDDSKMLTAGQQIRCFSKHPGYNDEPHFSSIDISGKYETPKTLKYTTISTILPTMTTVLPIVSPTTSPNVTLIVSTTHFLAPSDCSSNAILLAVIGIVTLLLVIAIVVAAVMTIKYKKCNHAAQTGGDKSAPPTLPWPLPITQLRQHNLIDSCSSSPSSTQLRLKNLNQCVMSSNEQQIPDRDTYLVPIQVRPQESLHQNYVRLPSKKIGGAPREQNVYYDCRFAENHYAT